MSDFFPPQGSGGGGTSGVKSLNGLTGALTLDTPNGTLAINPASPDVHLDIDLTHPNKWTGAQILAAITQTAGLASGATLLSSGSPYSVLDTDEVIIVTTGASGFTVKLPAASQYVGRKLVVMKADSGAGAVSITPAGTDTIEGTSSKSLSSRYNKIGLISDGVSTWYDLGVGGGI